MRVFNLACCFLLFMTFLPAIYAGNFKDVFGGSKKGKEKAVEDPHQNCVSKAEYALTVKERDRCRARLHEVMEVNYMLEMERDDLQIAIERLQNENGRRLLRMETRVRELEQQERSPILPPSQTIPLHHQQLYDAVPAPLQMGLHHQRSGLASTSQPMHPPPQSVPRRVPNVISSQSPGFQRALRANKSYNDMRRRQQAEHGPSGSAGTPF